MAKSGKGTVPDDASSMKMASPPLSLLTPPMSQAPCFQKLPIPDSAEWHLANEQRFIAIQLQRERDWDLEQKQQIANQQTQETWRLRDEGPVYLSKY